MLQIVTYNVKIILRFPKIYTIKKVNSKYLELLLDILLDVPFTDFMLLSKKLLKHFYVKLISNC